MDEALARLETLQRDGDSDDAFGWAHLQQATLWRASRCDGVAAE